MGEPYVALLRGINVGGNNQIRMAELADAFREAGYGEVRTYIQSGNVVFTAHSTSEADLERLIATRFGFDVPVLLLSRDELAAVVAEAPAEFSDRSYRADVMFLKRPLTAEQALAAFPPLADGVDRVWPGRGVVYFARVDALRTRTRITRIVGTPLYQQLSVRNWNTTRKLLELANGIS